MKTSLRIIFVCLFFAFISASPVFSATWNGGGADNLASTAGNWAGSVLPPTGDTILFNNTSSKDCTWNISDVNKSYTVFVIDGVYAGAVSIDATGILTIFGAYLAPAAPTGLNATAISSSRIDLSWTDNATTETGFRIERKTGIAGSYNQIGTAGVNANSYSDIDPSLTFATTYYYQVKAYDIFGESAPCPEGTATTFAVAPTATTNEVSNNAGTTATLNGTINPNGADTTVSFEWGTTTSYGNTATVPTVPAGLTDVAVTANITGLTPNTPYHYRVRALNSIGTTVYGLDVPFTTPVIAPSATTNAVSNNTATTPNSATLNGSVNPNGAATDINFQWGTDTSYGNTTTTQSIPTGNNNVAVTANILGLSVNTTYHCRVVATNSAGTTNGGDISFTTPSHAKPFGTTNSATNKNGNSATLNATVNPNDLITSVHFEWGTTASYGHTTTPSTSLPAGPDNISVSANITGLSPNQTYHFRVVATNDDGTINGSDMTFTTPPITITIVSPTDGSTIYRPDTMVKGSFTTTITGTETGITVNGIVGTVYSNQFAVNHVPLVNGANTISVTASDTAANTATTAITVNAVIPYPYVKLTANPESGASPLTVNFTASTAIPNTVTTYKIDYDGNGTDDYTGSTITNISHTYSTPGIYYAKLTVVDSSSVSYTDTVAIVVLNSTDFEGSLKGKWNAMKAALGDNNVTDALNYYSQETQSHYSDLFSALYSSLPQISSAMPDIHLIVARGNQAKFRLTRNETAGTISYYVYFILDSDGIWKIYKY